MTDEPEINTRHLGIGCAVVVLAIAVIAQAWGIGVLVLLRDLVWPILRSVH